MVVCSLGITLKWWCHRVEIREMRLVRAAWNSWGLRYGFIASVVGGFLVYAGTQNNLPTEAELTKIEGEVIEVRRVVEKVKGVDVTTQYEIHVQPNEGQPVAVKLPVKRVTDADTRGMVGKKLVGGYSKLRNFWFLNVDGRQLLTYESTLRSAKQDDSSLLKMGTGLALAGVCLLVFGGWRLKRRGLA